MSSHATGTTLSTSHCAMPDRCSHALLFPPRSPVAHRDLKLENVLVTEDGRYVLCDFGSATSSVLGADRSRREALEAEEIISRHSTQMYRAPEMVDLHLGFVVDTQVDVWALGCILYALCFGAHPFSAESTLSILSGAYTIPGGSPYSESVHELIRAALVRDPAERITAAALLARLNGTLRRKQATSSVPAPRADSTPLHAGGSSRALGSPATASPATASPVSGAAEQVERPSGMRPLGRGDGRRPTELNSNDRLRVSQTARDRLLAYYRGDGPDATEIACGTGSGSTTAEGHSAAESSSRSPASIASAAPSPSPPRPSASRPNMPRPSPPQAPRPSPPQAPRPSAAPRADTSDAPVPTTSAKAVTSEWAAAEWPPVEWPSTSVPPTTSAPSSAIKLPSAPNGRASPSASGDFRASPSAVMARSNSVHRSGSPARSPVGQQRCASSRREAFATASASVDGTPLQLPEPPCVPRGFDVGTWRQWVDDLTLEAGRLRAAERRLMRLQALATSSDAVE